MIRSKIVIYVPCACRRRLKEKHFPTFHPPANIPLIGSHEVRYGRISGQPAQFGDKGDMVKVVAHRIMFQLKQNRVNNISIEILVKEILGYEVEVIDLGFYYPENLLYMNDGTTFINDMDYAIWNTSTTISRQGAFHVSLTDPLYSSLTSTEKMALSAFIDSVKQIGTKAFYEL